MRKKKGIQNIHFGKDKKKAPLLFEQSETLSTLYGPAKIAVSITLPVGLYNRLESVKIQWEQNRSVFLSYLIHQGFIRMKSMQEPIKVSQEGVTSE